MKSGDSLAWAVYQNDEALTRELLAISVDGLKFNIHTAAYIAIQRGHRHLFELLASSPELKMEFIVDHNDKSPPKTCILIDLFQEIDFSACSDDNKRKLFKKVVDSKHRHLVTKWAPHTPQNSFARAAGDLIELGWEEEFLMMWNLHHQNIDNDDAKELACKSAKHGRLHIWNALTNRHHLGPSFLVEHAVYNENLNIFDAFWDCCEPEKKHSFFTKACAAGKNDVVNWMMNRCVDQLPMAAGMMEVLVHNNIQLTNDIFNQASSQLRHEMAAAAKEHNCPQNISSDKQQAWSYFQEMMALETSEDNEEVRRQKQREHSLRTFDFSNTHTTINNIDHLALLSPAQQRDVLMAAAAKGQEDVVRLIVEHGSPDSLACPIVAAAKNGHERLVEFLIDGTPQDQILLAINAAMEKGQTRIFERLFPLLAPEYGSALVRRAVVSDQPDILDTLLARGAQVDHNDQTGWMMVGDWAESHGDHLLPRVAHMFPKHPYNATLFERSVKHGKINSAKALLDRFDHDAVSFHQLMSNACKRGDLGMVRFLIPHFNFNNRLIDTIGKSIFHGHFSVTMEMMKHSTDKEINSELLWCLLNWRTTNKKQVEYLTKFMIPYCEFSSPNNKLLVEFADTSSQSVVDLLYDCHSLDQIKTCVMRLMMVEDLNTPWSELHVVKRYLQDAQRQEIADEVEDLGVEAKKRVM